MASVNKVILIGNCGKDPETRYSASGEAVTNITLATTDSWKDKSGEKKETTEWHRVVFFRKLAEIAGQYLKKGSQVYIEGSIRTRKWKDQSGQDRYTTEIVADEMKMLGGRGSAPTIEDSASQGEDDYSASAQAKPTPQPVQTHAAGGALDDDVPFGPVRHACSH